MKPLFNSFLLVLFLSIVAGCSESKTESSGTETNTQDANLTEQSDSRESQTEQTQSALEQAESYFQNPVSGAMGEAVELNGRQVTVTEFGEAEPQNPGMFEVPDGQRLVYIKTTVENVNAEPWKSNILQFFLRDASGEEYPPTFYPVDKGDRFPQQEMSIGDISTGFIGFEVNNNVDDLILAYAVRLDLGEMILIELREE